MNLEPQNHTTSKFRRNLVIALGILWMLVPAFLGILLLTEIGPVGDWLRSQPNGKFFIFVGIFAITTGFGLLPPYAQAILGGWVFGAEYGTIAVMCGLLGGATIGFFFARIISGASIIGLIDRNPRGRVIRTALVESNQHRTFFLILLLRLPPNSPFAIANLAMGAAGVRALPFLAGTGIGMLPRTFFICGTAATAAATGAHDLQELLAKQGWGWIAVGVGCLLVALFAIRMVSISALKRAGLMEQSPPSP
ncbi:MAG: TVP38/TMEM64 family protein [Phycisphaerales bacterium]|jgi:uncharacterized membrane protein YdjX (TVP38/TMEM64 family)